MKKGNILGLTVIVAIAAVTIFAGCIEEKLDTKNWSTTPTAKETIIENVVERFAVNEMPDPYFPSSYGNISTRTNVEYTYDGLGRALGGIVRMEVANKGGSGEVFVSTSRGPMGEVGTYEGFYTKVFHMDKGERVIISAYFEGLRASGYGAGEEVIWTVRPASPTDKSGQKIQVVRVGSTVDPLIEALKDEDGFVREVAARALGDLRDKRAIDVLIDVLKDKNESANVRGSAAEALGEIGDERTIEALINAGYVYIVSQMGKPAVEPLIKAGVPEALSDMYAFHWSMVPGNDERKLRNYLKDEFNTDWVENAEIRKIDGDKAIVISSGQNHIEIRLDYYRDKATIKISDGRTHELKIKKEEGELITYGSISDTRAVEPLIIKLNDKNYQVRKNAAEALGRIGDKRAVEPLIEALKDESNVVRINAVRALGDIDDERAVDALIKALENKDIRQSTIETFVRIGDKRAVEPLIEVLRKDDDKNVRWWAINALGRIGDKRAVDPLIEALKDKDWGVRQGAAYALGGIGDKRATEALTKALEDENENVREAASYALKIL